MKKFIVILAAIISPDTSLYTSVKLEQWVQSNDINVGNVFTPTSKRNIKKILTL